jgi:iron-sulfur cluster repair protein YtfE (RIC family)
MAAPGHDLLTEVHITVKNIEKKLDAHILDETKQDEAILFPMYNAWQQSKGAAKLVTAMWVSVAAIIGGLIARRYG